jgi:ribosomal protein L11 methyltransferase
MHWLQISLEASGDAEQVEDALIAAGAVAVSLTNASERQLFEPLPGTTPLWERSHVTGLFPSSHDPALVLAVLQNRLGPAAPSGLRVELLEDRDWVRAWMDNFRPMPFGNRLWVCPSGFEVDRTDAVVVHLDPGLAFGTGTHPSTALCLRYLDAAELQDLRVLDYGCGSGILAVAAARLGAGVVYATDIDPQALTATRDNAGRNNVSAIVHACPPEALPAQPVDLLVANILSGPLVELAPQFASRVCRGGRLVLAGLVESQAAEVRDAYARWFRLEQTGSEDGWVRLSGMRLG